MTDLMAISRFWVAKGVAVIPVLFRDKRPDGKLLAGGWDRYKTTLPTDAELSHWFTGSLHNIGLVVGWQNLTVVDFDSEDVYNKWLLWTFRRGGYTESLARSTYQVQTARGVHLYIYTPYGEQNRKLPGVDVKARGGYVLIPPSVHPSGVEYKVINPGAQIMGVEALSDILPADLLLKDTEYLPGVGAIPGITVKAGNDPWAAALNVPDPSRDLVTQVREKRSLLEFLPGAIQTSTNGRWYIVRCPFHDDQHPSFWVDTQRGICGCYGSCTPKPLDVINLYARMRGITNRESIFYLSRI